MSLENAAKHLAAHGRGPDTQLVHMSNREVAGLQALAKAHGKSLTVNPKTGLAEAGILDSLLPVVLGGASTYFTGSPYAGMALAGAMGYEKGGLKSGLMAGLSAYGGGQLASGLMGAGASTADAAAGALGVEGAATGAGSQAAILAAQNAGFGQAGLESLGQSAAVAQGATPVIQPASASLAQGVQGLSSKAGQEAFMANMGGGKGLATAGLMAAAPLIADQLIGTKTKQPDLTPRVSAPPQRLAYNAGRPVDAQGRVVTPAADVPTYESGMGSNFGREQVYFPNAGYQVITPEQARQMRGYADGGVLAGGGPVEQMSNDNAVGANTGFPQADISGHAYATPWQTPISSNVLTGSADTNVDPITGAQKLAHGGLSDLGGYSDGGRLLKGPGDGVSDSIPATIGNKRPARLADGEFVVPARIVSELGNGSTDAGARKLYAMLDRVQSARKKSIGKGKVANNSRADKFLPA